MREIIVPEMPKEWMDDTLTPPRWKWHEPACYEFPRRWRRLIRARLTGGAFTLWAGLLAHMGWENRITVSLGIIGREMGMAPATLTRALRCLETARMVWVDRTQTTRPVVTVSPYLVWKGRPHLVYKARKAFDAQCAMLEAPTDVGTPHAPVSG